MKGGAPLSLSSFCCMLMRDFLAEKGGGALITGGTLSHPYLEYFVFVDYDSNCGGYYGKWVNFEWPFTL